MSPTVNIKVVHGFVTAQTAIRRKGGLESLELSEGARKGVLRVFGEPLSAEQVVDRIIADVRSRGDDAIRHYSREIDRVELHRLTSRSRNGKPRSTQSMAPCNKHCSSLPNKFVHSMKSKSARPGSTSDRTARSGRSCGRSSASACTCLVARRSTPRHS
jgi:hypothetical protein